jgi:hypothetical protein
MYLADINLTKKGTKATSTTNDKGNSGGRGWQ